MKQVDDSPKVFVVAPIGRDGTLTVDVLANAGIHSSLCKDLSEVTECIERVDCIVMTEESLHPSGYERLRAAVARQPAWSDLPIVLISLTGSNSATVRRALDDLGNVALVERPLSASVLVSLVRAGRLARLKQYQIRDQLIDLREAQSQMERSNAAKDELLALISHELRTPLVSVLGLSEVLVRRTNLDAQERSDAQEQILSEAHRLHRIVDNMLVLAHAETMVDAIAEPILLHRSLARIVSRLQRVPRQNKLAFSSDADFPPVLGHETYLDQVISNLVHNAEKYGLPSTPISIAAGMVGDQVEVTISNEGSVIASDTIERLFRAFERGEQATGPLPGLGLGLAVCKRLMDAQQGEIFAVAPEAGGLEVHLRFIRAD